MFDQSLGGINSEQARVKASNSHGLWLEVQEIGNSLLLKLC